MVDIAAEVKASPQWSWKRVAAELSELGVGDVDEKSFWEESHAGAAVAILKSRFEAEVARARTVFAAEKRLFLDIDGVLNRTQSASHVRLDPDLVRKLRNICVRAGNVKIVLSTFWREFDAYLVFVLGRLGVPAPVVGRTPGNPTDPDYDRGIPRAREISACLRSSSCPPGVPYVIIDDRSV
ncbi:hypothetical protein CTAYLR_008071 [Chrysophaeum taylorii]|uniref:Uncharacterized protein n=1 Tax=Chrysophaeum taylorii TaxID=2483200 RepID=A0AAD7UJH4_9STRA|nr:hypothetical protein CTAYLR_008071 [Chrysophaeum taylorii]